MTYRFGPRPHDRGVEFTVWAPAQSAVALVLEGQPDRAMTRDAEGFFTLDVAEARPGDRYWFRLAEGLRADPASRFQPEGPLGPSQIVDTRAFQWTDSAWRGLVAPHQHVFYEMHVGTFTREGTWSAAIAKLPLLVDVGISTLEVMPLAEFSGSFGWGYDGVNFYAPTRLYGAPDDVQRFVNEAHRLGLAVILDVVYNHFGPVGNFSAEFSKSIAGQPGEWGDSINYDGDGSAPVRAFMTENAAYWIREFHFDGLRLDATHGIHDRSQPHIIAEICRAARDAASGRELFIVGENEPQDTRLLRRSGGQHDGLDALWNEDWHHAAFVALTGRREAYFTDYRGTAPEFAAMARHGTLYQGQWYSWQKQGRGGVALGIPPSSFVTFLENHDQVANTGLGDRLHQRVHPARWRAMTALLLLGPGLPLLFQGQEFGSSRPFAYFADHAPELAAAVEKGRLEFLSQFPSLAADHMRPALPKPSDAQTFAACKLEDAERSAASPVFRLHADLLTIRRSDDVLRDMGTDRVRIESSAPASAILLIRYMAQSSHRLLVVNLGPDHLSPMNDPLLAPVPDRTWTVLWSSEHPGYGGTGTTGFRPLGRWRIPGSTATLLAPA